MDMEQNQKRYAVLSRSPWSHILSAYVLAPITSSTTDKENRPKELLHVAEIPKDEAKQDWEGLLLVTQLETLCLADVCAEWQDARLVRCKHQLENPTTAAARDILRQVLLTKNALRTLRKERPKRLVSQTHTLASGDLVFLKKSEPGALEPWLLVSSDFYLRVLEILAHRNDNALARPFVALVPITPNVQNMTTPSGLTLDPIPPVLPSRSFCHAPLIVARKLEYIMPSPAIPAPRPLLEKVAETIDQMLGLVDASR